MSQYMKIGIFLAFFVTMTTISLGDNLEEGLDAAERGDYEKAYSLWLVEAQNGNASAQTNIGVLYAKGRGVKQDEKTAVKWFQLAAVQGDAKAQANLGFLYAIGLGVPHDDKEAAKWFQMAAIQGDAKAQANLGIMYDVGRGVLKNYVVACAWYTLSVENGNEQAQSLRDSILEKMSSTEIEMSELLTEQLRKEIVD